MKHPGAIWQFAFSFALLSLGAARSACASEIPLAKSGPYQVAITNLEVKVPDKGKMFDYLNGTKAGDRYLSDLLLRPEAVQKLEVLIPSDSGEFGKHAGQRVTIVMYVVYPTAADNPRPSYTFPYAETGDQVFPHMELPGQKPILAAAASGKFPLIVYSGGFNTHGLWHLEHLKLLASHGYIVVDVFHGDGRFDGFGSAMSIRPIVLKSVIDWAVQHPDFGPAIDASRIGLSGASAGGHSILTVAGGVDPSKKHDGAKDPRIKAAFAVVPYLGGLIGVWPFQQKDWRFGETHAGLREVVVPFLAAYGSADKNVTPEGVESALNALSGPAVGIRLENETHSLSKGAESDAYSWELLWFDAYLRDNIHSLEKLKTANSAQDGGSDRKTIYRGI